jgi:adenylate cyclase
MFRFEGYTLDIARNLLPTADREVALRAKEATIRLDPFALPIFSSGFMGLANYMLKRYPEAARWLRETPLRLPNLQLSHLWLASAYAQSGQLEEARKEGAEVLRINPGFTIEGYKRILLYKGPKDLEHRLDGTRKAGLPNVGFGSITCAAGFRP